jgi:hypothetical protein
MARRVPTLRWNNKPENKRDLSKSSEGGETSRIQAEGSLSQIGRPSNRCDRPKKDWVLRVIRLPEKAVAGLLIKHRASCDLELEL